MTTPLCDGLSTHTSGNKEFARNGGECSQKDIGPKFDSYGSGMEIDLPTEVTPAKFNEGCLPRNLGPYLDSCGARMEVDFPIIAEGRINHEQDLNFDAALPRISLPASQIKEFYQFIERCDQYELGRNWFVHEFPNLLVMTGHQLKNEFITNRAIGCRGMAATVSLLSCKEGGVDDSLGLEPIRIFVCPPTFLLEFLKRPVQRDIHLAVNLLCGSSSVDQVAGCREVSIPVIVEDAWCLYTAQLKEKILDPVMINESEERYEARHMEFVYSLLDGLNEVGPYVSKDWSFDLEDWKTCFNEGTFRACSPVDSGTVVLQFARWLAQAGNGQASSEDSLEEEKMKLLHDIVMMSGNMGGKPSME